MKNIIFILTTIGILLSFSCSKTKKYSNRLGGYKWKVIEMTIDGTSDTNHPTILFKACDIYDEICSATWTSAAGGRSQIVWQFRNNGKVFEFSNQTDHTHTLEDVKSAEQNISYSGVYQVIENKRKLFSVKSSVTNGFNGKEVVIKMERLD